MLDNLCMKPSDKISTYNVDFICYTSQLGWGNSVLCHCYYQRLPQLDPGSYLHLGTRKTHFVLEYVYLSDDY